MPIGIHVFVAATVHLPRTLLALSQASAGV
jgi:hypothetical protein